MEPYPKSNCLNKEELRVAITNAMGDIKSFLEMHCGVNATYACRILEKGLRNLNPVVFSADGIESLNSVTYTDPIANYMKNMIGYAGTRVNTVAYDGTTSTMLILTMAILKCLESDVIKSSDIKEACTTMLEDIEKYRITCKDLVEDGLEPSEAYGKIAYHQTMVTAKQDKLLANCMKEIFEITPKELFPFFTHRTSDVETEERFSVHYSKTDAYLNISVHSNINFNTAMGTQYLEKDSDLIILEADVAAGVHSYDLLFNHLKETQRPTVVLYDMISADIIKGVHDLNTIDRPITLFKYHSGFDHVTQIPIMLKCLNAISGVKPIHMCSEEDVDAFVIKGVRVFANGSILRLDNLFPTMDDTTYVHPWYNVNPDEAPEDIKDAVMRYHYLLAEIMIHTERLKKAHTEGDDDQYELFVSAAKALIGPRLPVIQIGGMTMDVYAAKSVLNDVQGAISATLDDGFVIDGNLKAIHALKVRASKSDNPAYKVLYEVFEELMCIIHDIGGDELHTRIKSVIPNTYKYDKTNLLTPNGVKFAYLNTVSTEVKFWAPKESDDQNPIIQPIPIYHEIFKRLLEILPKITNCSHLIVPIEKLIGYKEM